MRHEILYLTEIVEAAARIAEFLREIDAEAFGKSDLVRSAVVHKLSIIGEAAARIPGALRAENPEVPWREIMAFRNILVHAYFGIDWELVWGAAKERCPILRDQVSEILAVEYGRGE